MERSRFSRSGGEAADRRRHEDGRGDRCALVDVSQRTWHRATVIRISAVSGDGLAELQEAAWKDLADAHVSTRRSRRGGTMKIGILGGTFDPIPRRSSDGSLSRSARVVARPRYC